MNDPEVLKRKRPAPNIDFSYHSSSIVFVTVCSKDRKLLLASKEIHQSLACIWADSSNWYVGRYVIMPDHIHLFAATRRNGCNLDSWIKYWKSHVTRTTGMKDLWQKNSWSHRLRNGESYGSKWLYVYNNPVRHGLVREAQDWPYQGEIYHLTPYW